VLYGNPESIEESFIRAVAAHPNVCSYFDLPIQHASNRILKRMGRRYTADTLRTLFRRIREIVPRGPQNDGHFGFPVKPTRTSSACWISPKKFILTIWEYYLF